MYYTALDQAIRQKDVGRSNRLAWQKMRNSAVYDENDENGYDSQAYRMSVIPRNHNTDTDESMWRDQDSAVGVDVSGRVTPHRQQQQQNLMMTNDDRAFVVRKRETSTATTAHSVYSDANDPVDVSLMAPVQQIASSNGILQVVHHCEIAMVQLDERGKNDRNRESEESGLFSNDSDVEEEEEGLPFVQRIRMQSTSPHRLDVMGINRPFGSFLPAVVAWMDGLDIRYN
ncbi:hypothetical protein FB645_002658 [Coemansia sp. IMI 203386]|nr:hypothetical protein FB645_002658 [Coemansia sp. IMI 203386]